MLLLLRHRRQFKWNHSALCHLIPKLFQAPIVPASLSDIIVLSVSWESHTFCFTYYVSCMMLQFSDMIAHRPLLFYPNWDLSLAWVCRHTRTCTCTSTCTCTCARVRSAFGVYQSYNTSLARCIIKCAVMSLIMPGAATVSCTHTYR